jgi:GMP synthase-like glutamine amidotransferase
VFLWHGDTFDIPIGAIPLAFSNVCNNQGFILNNRVVGFQFHLETTPKSARALIDNSHDELDGSLYVQSESEMLAEPQRFSSFLYCDRLI